MRRYAPFLTSLTAIAAAFLVRGAQAETTRIYVGNNGATTVSVIDHESLEVIKTVDIAAQPHGNIAAHKGDRIYVTTQDTGEVIAIDTRSNEIAWRVKAGENLHTPAISADDRYVFAPDWMGGQLAVVDTQSGTLAGEVAMINPETNEIFGGLHNAYELGDGAHLLVGAIFDETFVKVNMESRDIVHLYRLNGQPRPAAVLKDMSTSYIQLSELNGFIALDLGSGEEVKRIEWPHEGELPKYVDGVTPSHGIGLTVDNRELWAASSFTSQVYVYSVPDLEKLAVVDIGLLPNWIAVSSDGKRVYVTCQEPAQEHGVVAAIDRETRQVVNLIEVGHRPKKILAVDVPES